MLKIKFVLYLVVVFLSCNFSGITQTGTKNIISGEIKNLQKGLLQLILEQDINRRKRKIVAEIPVDDKGYFRYEKKLNPHVYTLQVNDQKSVMLAIDKGQKIFITGDAGGVAPLEVSGSEDTRKLMAYEAFRKESLNRLVNSIRRQTRELKEKGVPDNDPQLLALGKLEIENYAQHRDELIAYIKKEMGTSLAIYPTSIRWGGEKNIPFLDSLARRFKIAYPDTEIAEKINEKVKILKANAIGGKVAGINMPDNNGVAVSLVAVKAKYILIDFWASWCTPCRMESSLLGELYRTFKKQGFEIYAVALESTKDTWLNAIAQDKRTWINVSTLQGFETPAAFNYAVTSLPANVLIDRYGKVIAKNLHGNELRTVIEKLFK